VDGLSYETVRRLLKKHELKPWLTNRWCIPPEASSEFVWRMEDVLEVCTRPYDPKRPQVCIDEISKQPAANAWTAASRLERRSSERSPPGRTSGTHWAARSIGTLPPTMHGSS
jgi:hypothetical protein